MARIEFGTDGWRGLIAGDFTFDNVALCAQGVAKLLSQQGIEDRGLVVGFDTRFASQEFAGRVAEVMAGNGIRSYLAVRPTPTPVATYNILRLGAAGAAIITASHNPATWNGFKYKPDYAGSATPEITTRLEEEIESAKTSGVASMPLSQAREEGVVHDIDFMPPYVDHLAGLVDLEAISQSGLKVIVDSMYGAGGSYLPFLLGTRSDAKPLGTRTSVTEINGKPNPAFPGMERPEPVAANLEALSSLVMEKRADIGIAFDGDADRVGIVDEKGRFITPLETFALLTLYLLEIKGEQGALVKSLTTTSMIYRLGEVFGMPVFETQVGFKHICPIMLREDAIIGGEESGGYGFRGHIPERDGVLSGLVVLEYMMRTGKRLSELMEHLFNMVGPHHYQRRDVAFHPEAREEILRRLEGTEVAEVAGMPVVSTDSIDGRRFKFASDAWLLVRFSGTEPLIRIYAEGESSQQVEQLLDGAEALMGLV